MRYLEVKIEFQKCDVNFYMVGFSSTEQSKKIQFQYAASLLLLCRFMYNLYSGFKEFNNFEVYASLLLAIFFQKFVYILFFDICYSNFVERLIL